MSCSVRSLAKRRPDGQLVELKTELSMGLRLPGQESETCFFVTTSFIDHQRLGNIEGVYESLGEAFRFCLEKNDAKLLSYVFMPSHLHAVLLLEGGKLAGLMRDTKKYTAEKSLKQYAIQGKLWQPRYDRVVIWTRQVLATKVTYIHNNPVKAGLVAEPEDWKWSSASDYFLDKESPLPVWKEWWV